MNRSAMPLCRQRARHRPARGFGVIAALVVLVLLASLAAAMVRIGAAEHLGSAQGLQAARATWAAASGLDWGAYQALKGSWTSCSGASQTLDLSADSGMWVSVSCTSTPYREGETAAGTTQTVRAYTLTATACNAPSGCPDAARAVTPGYVERVRQAVFVY